MKKVVLLDKEVHAFINTRKAELQLRTFSDYIYYAASLEKEVSQLKKNRESNGTRNNIKKKKI